MRLFSGNIVSVYNIMELEKVQKQQFNKILSVYNGHKYEEHTYCDGSDLLIFKNSEPLRKKCFHCDRTTYECFHQFISNHPLLDLPSICRGQA
jgi:hypothetical protein